jgi:multidrug transporter EmrE-like cation transporter
MQLFIIFSVAIITAVTSQLLFKKGVSLFVFNKFSLNEILLLIKYIFSNWFLLGGIFFYGISFLLWIIVLSKTKLSFAYPITSINFILVVIASYYLFGEKLILFQYLGIVLIILGVFFLSK